MAVPATLTATAGEKATATAVNGGYRDPLDFLMNPPKVHAYDNTGLACGNGSTITLTLSGEVYDTDSMHSTSSSTERITFTTAGTYLVTVTVQWPNATYTVSDITINLNGAGLRTQNFQTARVSQMTFSRFFNATDYISFELTQTSGASRTTVVGAFATYVTALWVAES
ncbi:MAG TPA: hypothetical protein VFM55_18880 [Micromonosporaceae bacterium]|nr:hypothetical protein [Micromonosporaceae bacterium]